jgi:hypothetical protein
MSVASPPSQTPQKPSKRVVVPGSMQVSKYDQVSSLLISLLMLIGFVVLLMFLIWLSSQFNFRREPVPVTFAEELGGGGKGNMSPNSEQQLDEVTPEEVADLQEVQVDKTLESISAAVAEQMPNLEAMVGASGLGNGEGPGTGDSRGPGPGGPGTATQLPDWEVRFKATSLEEYAKQLDFFGIELGALGGGKSTVDYAASLSKARPDIRSTNGKGEGRRYLMWRKGPLARADKDLLQKAGIDAESRTVLQFLPPPTEKKMADLEIAHAKGKRTHEIRRTVFGVKGTPGNYQFYILEQDYRN